MTVFKTELHCHTNQSSKCGQVTAEDVVEAYFQKGYSTLVLTDHYGYRHIGKFGAVDEKEHFLLGYRAAQKAARGRIHVLLGMEISLEQYPQNDYLVFGDVEVVVEKYPEMFRMELPAFCTFAHENDLMVYQAHPFRNRITVVDPAPLDGIEVYNAHPRHASRNEIAAAWASQHQKKAIAGSDAHQPQDIARAGILTSRCITNETELRSVLSNATYQLILC